MTTFEEAAELRAASVRARADRPSQRRCAEYARSGLRVGFRSRIEVRAGEGPSGLRFSGVASVTETPYEMFDAFGPYNEVVSRGAFTDTLRTPGLDVPLVIGHDQIRRIARTTNGTLTLTESDQGLEVRADLDPTDPDVAYIAPKLAAGLLDEMSFGFRIVSGVWSPDYTEYRLNVADINRGDVSIVGWGANPNTSGGLVKKSADEPAVRATRIDRAVFDALYGR